MKIGFPGMLTLIFITLKLTGYIAWSWWWVLSPLWIGVAVFGAFMAFGLVLIAIAAVGAAWLDR